MPAKTDKGIHDSAVKIAKDIYNHVGEETIEKFVRFFGEIFEIKQSSQLARPVKFASIYLACAFGGVEISNGHIVYRNRSAINQIARYLYNLCQRSIVSSRSTAKVSFDEEIKYLTERGYFTQVDNDFVRDIRLKDKSRIEISKGRGIARSYLTISPLVLEKHYREVELNNYEFNLPKTFSEYEVNNPNFNYWLRVPMDSTIVIAAYYSQIVNIIASVIFHAALFDKYLKSIETNIYVRTNRILKEVEKLFAGIPKIEIHISYHDEHESINIGNRLNLSTHTSHYLTKWVKFWTVNLKRRHQEPKTVSYVCIALPTNPYLTEEREYIAAIYALTDESFVNDLNKNLSDTLKLDEEDGGCQDKHPQ